MPGSGPECTITVSTDHAPNGGANSMAEFRGRCGASGRGTLNLETVGTLLLIGAVGFGSVAFTAIAALFVVVGVQRDSG